MATPKKKTAKKAPAKKAAKKAPAKKAAKKAPAKKAAKKAPAKKAPAKKGPAREALEMSTVLPVTPEQIYRAWLDPDEHAAFTGATATIDPVVGGKHTAWDGYIEGTFLELEPPSRIVATWRTSEFAPEDPDSRLELRFSPRGEGTELVLKHTSLPAGGARKYDEGWRDYYFTPMRAHFGG